MEATRAAVVAVAVTTVILLRRRRQRSPCAELERSGTGASDAESRTRSPSWRGSVASGMIELVPPVDNAEAAPSDTSARRPGAELAYEGGSAQLAGCAKALMRPRKRWPHLPPFLLPTRCVDSNHGAVKSLATELTAACTTIRDAAEAIRAWVTREVVYSFEDKSNPASTILAARRGMCTNKATLQIALLRAVGIPAGYCVVHIHKTCFKPLVYDDIYRLISPVTVHVFCCAFIPEESRFMRFDATDDPAKAEYLVVLDTGETQFHPAWLAGPFGPVQSNVDHLLHMPSSGKLTQDMLDRQNKRFLEQATL